MEKNPKFEDFELNENNTNELFPFTFFHKIYREIICGYNNGKPFNKN